MKKIAAITFHSSYNHGSCLQAYALQEFVKNNYRGANYDIINLRTDRQKVFYKKPYDSLTIKNLIKRTIFLGYKKKFQTRQKNFENFIGTKLNITDEYSSLEELKNANFKYDYYISGSDQLWNCTLLDFDWSFFLEFVKTGKRISYAASFGPVGEKWSNEEIDRAKMDLAKYDHISVREPGSQNMVKKILGVSPTINVDPTLLLSEKEWEKVASHAGERKKDYIFLYDLKGLKKSYDIARALSKKYKMPVVIVKENSKRHSFYRFDKRYDAGPADFLSYVKNAKLVVSSSFHGTVFSVLFKKPFVAVDGTKDFRINNILEKMNLVDRSVENVSEACEINDIFSIDYSSRDKVIEAERKASKKYLDEALGE